MVPGVANAQRDFDRRRAAVARTQKARRRWRGVVVTGAVAATAVAGSIGTSTDTAWFRNLDKPRWYPPAVAFPTAWTVLYALIAWAATRGLNRADRRGRRRIAAHLAANLGLNAAWSWTFFRARRPGLSLGTILALDASNVALVRAVGRHDATAGAALVPYVGWTAFATALTEELWYRNR
ncbi:tryptophan-rich sensory protein [Cellulomonas fimi]|uniref:Tryptophan-rich sensory protein n=1 Tax=Cellulomonas fimi TaxID=1708 RepID=A0A7Y0QHG2_CELFI|nr:tryptophan-rich sensory protein [Cellulomonas fimi]